MAKKKTKSAAKKKAAAKSTEEKKKTTAKKSSAKKASVKKTSTAKKTSAAKTKSTKATKTKKAQSVKKSKVTLKELLSRKFEKPDNIVIESAPKRKSYDAIPDAPPFFEMDNAKELERLKGLLMQKIDITDIPPPKPKPKKKLPIAELIRQKYAVSPKSLWEPPEKIMHLPDPPPYIEASDSDQQTKIRSLLFQTISLKDVQPLAETPKEEKSEPVPAKIKKDKPAIPVSELLKNNYSAWTPPSVIPSPVKSQASIPDPPPFIAGSPDEIRRIRELLFKKIDITIPEPVQEQKPDTTDNAKQAEQTDVAQQEKIEPDEQQIELKPNEETEPTPSKEEISAEANDKEEIAETLITPESDYSDYTLESNKETQLISNFVKVVFAGILILFIMLYMASSSNQSKYYLVDGKAGVEVWQGTFSPMGKSYMLTLMGMEIPETEQEFYSQSEIYPLICSFYLDQASDVLSEDNIPNLVQVKEYLEIAHQFANEDIQRKIQKRLNGIDFMTFVLKADMAIQKGSEIDIEKAREYIEEAKDLAEKNYQKDMIKDRLQMIEGKKTVKQPAPSETESKPEDASKKTTHVQEELDRH
jgi:hypothetical protein